MAHGSAHSGAMAILANFIGINAQVDPTIVVKLQAASTIDSTLASIKFSRRFAGTNTRSV